MYEATMEILELYETFLDLLERSVKPSNIGSVVSVAPAQKDKNKVTTPKKGRPKKKPISKKKNTVNPSPPLKSILHEEPAEVPVEPVPPEEPTEPPEEEPKEDPTEPPEEEPKEISAEPEEESTEISAEPVQREELLRVPVESIIPAFPSSGLGVITEGIGSPYIATMEAMENIKLFADLFSLPSDVDINKYIIPERISRILLRRNMYREGASLPAVFRYNTSSRRHKLPCWVAMDTSSGLTTKDMLIIVTEVEYVIEKLPAYVDQTKVRDKFLSELLARYIVQKEAIPEAWNRFYAATGTTGPVPFITVEK